MAAGLRLENEETLNRIYLEGDRVRYQPKNTQMDPIYVAAESVQVLGREIGVIRRMT